MSSSPNNADVIILGGGVAGLAAAQNLGRAGLRVTLFEARDRLGGRIDTRHDPLWPGPIERGAEFIHGLPPETWDLVGEAKLQTVEVSGQHLWAAGGRPQPGDDRWQRIERVLARLPRVPNGDCSFTEFLARYCGDLSGEDHAAARAYVEGFNAADSRRISTGWLAVAEQEFDKIHAEQSFRLPTGYDGLVEALAESLDSSTQLHLSAPVRAVHWQPGNVQCQVTIEGQSPAAYEGRAAVVTLPVGVLQAAPDDEGGVRWTPPLPGEKLSALGQLVMGPVIKVFLCFREAFWQADFPELGFLHSLDGSFPTWWTALPLERPVLTGWAGGVAAERLAHLSDADLVNRGLEDLARMFLLSSPLGEMLIAGQVAHWQRDPWARGAYGYAVAGGADAPTELARPVADTLFFAGEATHAGLSGTVAGALASGYRAADEVLAALGKQ